MAMYARVSPAVFFATCVLGMTLSIDKKRQNGRGLAEQLVTKELSDESIRSIARGFALELEGCDILLSNPGVLTEKQQKARFVFSNFPVVPLLSDIINLPRQSLEYRLAVTALRFNCSLLNYERIREAYPKLDGDLKKQTDLVGILRSIQFNAIFIKIILSPTFVFNKYSVKLY